MTESGGEAVANPYLAGILTSVVNPYFWIWWFSVGSMFVLDGLRGGLLLASIFMVGHWGADFGWYTLVAASFARGKSVLSVGRYRMVLAICGVCLIIFGLIFISKLVL
jgi:threonine/homoserine/homoserine lactone efflux protein